MRGAVFVTGGSGFVGSAAIEALLSRGYAVNALVNRRPIKANAERVNSIPGGLFDPKGLRASMQGCAAVIHTVGIIMEQPKRGIPG